MAKYKFKKGDYVIIRGKIVDRIKTPYDLPGIINEYDIRVGNTGMVFNVDENCINTDVISYIKKKKDENR